MPRTALIRCAPAPMSYTVRGCSPSDAREALTRLWSDTLNMSGDPRHKFDWFYLGNPLGEAQAFLLDAPPAGTVGCCGIGRRTLHIDGRAVRGGLLADFAVARDHRTLLPALMLQRALSEYARREFDVTYAFPNESAVGVLTRVGFSHLGRMGRYVRVLRSAPFVSRYIRPRALAAVAGRAVDTFLTIDAHRRSLRSRDVHLEWLDDVDDRFDDLWRRAHAQYACIGDRSQEFLRWRLMTRPGLGCAIAALVERGGSLAAYAAVIEKQPGVALIADFFAERSIHLQGLFARLFPALRRRGFNTAVTFFLGSDAVADTLRSSGFVFRHSTKFVVIAPGQSAVVQPGALTDDQRWFVTEADRDN